MNIKSLHRVFIAVTALYCMASCDDTGYNSVEPAGNGLESQTIFVATDRHDVGQGNNLKALVQIVSQNLKADKPDFYFLGGDNVGKGGMSDSLAAPAYSLDDVYSEIIGGDGRSQVNFLTTYGSHDNGCTDSYYDFFSGPRACNGYYLYGISYAQMCYAADSSAQDYTGLDKIDAFGVSAQTASRAFLRWAGTLNDSAPIIVMSHVPIHANRGDNPGGAIWADALNEVASEHDIILMFGHNHTSEERAMNGNQSDPQGNNPDSLNINGEGGPMPNDSIHNDSIHTGSNPQDDTPHDSISNDSIPQAIQNTVNEQDYYLVLPGSSLPVQTADRSVQDTITIKFVYMNAGYLKLGYASTIKLLDSDSDGSFDSFKIKRYTVSDTVISCFGNTDIPNPVTLGSKGRR